MIQLEPVQYIRAFATPDPILRFKDEHLTTRLRETPGTAQPGEACADDDDIVSFHTVTIGLTASSPLRALDRRVRTRSLKFGLA